VTECFASAFSKNVKVKVHKIIIMLPAFTCGCENWSFTLKVRTRIVFENGSLGSKRKKVSGG
jgi:hypothetical protein